MPESAQERPSGATAPDEVMPKGPPPTNLSTQPEPNQSWQITLAGKVIASKGYRYLRYHNYN